MMWRMHLNRLPPRCLRRTFSMVEVVISTLIVSLMLVAALDAVGSARTGLNRISHRTRGMLLAQDLMSEILQQAYCDPSWGLGSLGPGADETAAGNRSLYDDVDDYDGWKSVGRPEYKDGTPIDWATGYTREVTVAWITAGNVGVVDAAETGIKRITVVVRYNSQTVAELTAIRTTGWTMATGG